MEVTEIKALNKKVFKNGYNSIFALVLALTIGGIVIAINGSSPLDAYVVLAKGAFGSEQAIIQTLNKAMPLIFSGLAVAIALKGGMLNIGVEGQIYMGAIAAAVTGVYVKGVPSFIHIIMCICIGMASGALWALIPAILKIKRGAHEVVTTIMLNYVAILFTDYLVNYPLKATGMIPQTEKILSTAKIPKIIQGTQLTWSIVIALGFAIICYVVMNYTSLGFEITATGVNSKAAEAGGVKVTNIQLFSMLLSGGLAGIGGALLVMSSFGRFIQSFSPGYGYDGIAVAMLSSGSPLGVLFGSVLFGALRTGGLELERLTSISSEFVVTLQGIIIIIISAPALFSILFKERGSNRWRE